MNKHRLRVIFEVLVIFFCFPFDALRAGKNDLAVLLQLVPWQEDLPAAATEAVFGAASGAASAGGSLHGRDDLDAEVRLTVAAAADSERSETGTAAGRAPRLASPSPGADEVITGNDRVGEAARSPTRRSVSRACVTCGTLGAVSTCVGTAVKASLRAEAPTLSWATTAA